MTNYLYSFIPDEMECTVLENGLRMSENGNLCNMVQINFNSKIRLIRAYCCRYKFSYLVMKFLEFSLVISTTGL